MAGLQKEEGGTDGGKAVSRLARRERSQFFERSLVSSSGVSMKSGPGQ